MALIIALAAPLLIMATGLTVDLGYWYEQQEALQSATDAAAIAAATAADKYNVSTTSVAENFALTAANEATNDQLALTSSSLTLSTSSVMVNGTASTQWTANATIPRRGFFSTVRGNGFLGMPIGTQTAKAAADVVAASSPACLIATQGTISVTGGGKVVGTNCGIASNDTSSGCSMSVTGSGEIIGTAVTTSASCVSAPEYSGYIGTNENATPAGSTSTVSLNAPAATDPLADMNPADSASDGMSIWNPGWTTPSAPAETGSPVSPALGWGTWDTSGIGSCTSGDCDLDPGYFTDMDNGQDMNSLVLNQGTNTGGTYITGGFSIQSNATTTLNGDEYYISGGMSLTSDNGLTIGSSTQTSPMTMVVNGGTYLTNGSATLYPGTYYLNGAMSGSNYTGWGLSTNISSAVTIDGPTYYVNGGIGITNGSPQVTLSSGLYELTSYAGNSNAANSSGGAFYAGQGTYVFGTPVSANAPAPNTYFFDGGLTISGGASSVTFNPGIYYIRNGNLDIGSGPTVTGNGVTFVLEGNAGFTIDAGATVSLSAPTSDCIAPANFPDPAFEGSAAPYDGTDGEGICGVLIYQSRGDTAADNVTEGASGAFNGAIYAPNAPLTVSGGAAMTINTTGLPGLEVASIADSGSGAIHLTDTTNQSSSGTTSTGVMLVQ